MKSSKSITPALSRSLQVAGLSQLKVTCWSWPSCTCTSFSNSPKNKCGECSLWVCVLLFCSHSYSQPLYPEAAHACTQGFLLVKLHVIYIMGWVCQKKVRLFPACRCREGSPAQTSQQYAWPILILNRNTIHILKSVQPVCSLASITGTTVLPHVIDHANPVETFSKLSKSFIPAKMPTTYISMTPLKDYCFLVFSNNLDTNTQLDTH